MAYGNNNYNNNNYNNYNQNRKPKKKSGCKTSVIQKGKHKGKISLHGWNVSKSRGYMTFSAFPKKDAVVHKSDNGRKWVPYLVIVKLKRSMEEKLFNGLYDPDSRKLIIDDMQMVANPNAPRGGYWGTWG